jgi:competence protein ComEC
MVPVGAGNRYGHPHPAVLAELAEGGARVLRTDTDGDIAAIRLDHHELAVVTRTPRGGRRPAGTVRRWAA